MKRFTFYLLLFTLTVFSACQKNGSPDSGGLHLLGDDTPKAVELVNSANDDLKKVKQIYKENQGKIAELQAAMVNKDIVKVREMANNLVSQINDGLVAGASAVKKIDDAGKLDINPTFKQYLQMKEDAMQKLLDAFDKRREAAQILRDGFGTADPQAIEKVKEAFKAKEAEFQKLSDEGQKESREADDLAKESLKNNGSK